MPSPPRRCSCGEDARGGLASSPRSPWGSEARRWRAAPTRVGALWPHTRRVRQDRSIVGWPACPGPGFARLDRLERRHAWLRRACGSNSRIWNPGSSGGGSGPCARPPRAPSGSCASSGLIGKDLALWEEGQEALMSQGGPSVRQVGVSGSSSSVRARSPTRDAYVSIDPGGTVCFSSLARARRTPARMMCPMARTTGSPRKRPLRVWGRPAAPNIPG